MLLLKNNKNGDAYIMNKLGEFNKLLCPEEIDAELSKLGKRLDGKFRRTYMKMALTASELSYCARLKVGSLIVTQFNEMLTGYNGTPSGFPNTCELPNQDVTNPITLHGEANGMSKAEQSTLSIRNASLFVTHIPCIECAKRIIQSGMKRVFYIHDYRLTDGLELLTDLRSEIQVIKLDAETFDIVNIHGYYKPILTVEDEFVYNTLLRKIETLENKIQNIKSCNCKNCQ